MDLIDREATVKVGLEPDVLSEPLSGGEYRAAPYSGTKALMFAVLEDGIRSYLSCKDRLHEEAERWIHGRQHRSVFSFVVICETLGLEPTALAQELRRLHATRTTSTVIGRYRPTVRGRRARATILSATRAPG
jgi:hypothetical protein